MSRSRYTTKHKAEALVAAGTIVRHGPYWVVPSSAIPDKRYYVDRYTHPTNEERFTCTCPANSECCHVMAVKMLLADAPAPTPAPAVPLCLDCGEPLNTAYLKNEETGETRCVSLRECQVRRHKHACTRCLAPGLHPMTGDFIAGYHTNWRRECADCRHVRRMADIEKCRRAEVAQRTPEPTPTPDAALTEAATLLRVARDAHHHRCETSLRQVAKAYLECKITAAELAAYVTQYQQEVA